MAVVTEAFESQSLTQDAGRAQLRRRFYVVREATDLPLPQFEPTTAPGIPTPNEPHPFVPGIKADRIQHESRDAPDRWTIDVFYSTGGAFTLPDSLPDHEPSFKSWEFDFTRQNVEMPRIIKTEKAFQSGGVTEVLIEHKERFRTRPWAFWIRARRRLNISSFDSASFGAIGSQAVKFHRFGTLSGAPMIWKFVGASISQVEPQRWTVVYEWVFDSGNRGEDVPLRRIDPNDDNSALELVPGFAKDRVNAGNAASVRVILPSARPPFHEYDVVVMPRPAGAPRGVYKEIVLVKQYLDGDVIDGTSVILPGTPLP